jgi:hypothetical protein
MADKKYGGDEVLIPRGRFGGANPSGNIEARTAPSPRMGRLDAADRMAAARKIAIEADKKSGVKPYSPPARGSVDSDTGKRTNPNTLSSGTYMKRRAGDSDNAFTTSQIMDAEEHPFGAGFKKGGKVSSASKRADGCAVRGKTKA